MMNTTNQVVEGTMMDLWDKNYNSTFLYYFNLKERHYINPPTNAWDLLQHLRSTTTGVVPLMLELVVTADANSIFTGDLRDELELCCYSTISSNTPDTQVGVSNNSSLISFSLSNFSVIISKIFQDPLLLLKILPSVLHKSAGRGY